MRPPKRTLLPRHFPKQPIEDIALQWAQESEAHNTVDPDPEIVALEMLSEGYFRLADSLPPEDRHEILYGLWEQLHEMLANPPPQGFVEPPTEAPDCAYTERRDLVLAGPRRKRWRGRPKR
jgi:hypothetical protein